MIALRATYGTPLGALQEPAAYQDLGPYMEASRLLAESVAARSRCLLSLATRYGRVRHARW